MALVLSVGVFSGCGPTMDGIDTKKTQIYVANYEGGIGRSWLDDAKERFETYYEDVSFEEGKTGVQVQIKSDKQVSLSQLKGSNHYIFFTGGVMFNNYIATGDFVELTDIVKNEKLPGENKTIEDKLNADTKAALTAVNGGYYALPSYQYLSGVTYNVHLFEEKGLYFADNPAEAPVQNAKDPRYGFILNKDVKKSTGPDALYGTSDDGLPSSVEEYKKLCDCMVHLNITPFICYAYSYHYTQHLFNSLWANLAGYDQVMLSLSADSTRFGTTDIVELNSNGQIVKQGGKIKIIEDQSIDSTNGYLLSRQASRYYALDFMQYIFSPERVSTYMTPASLTSALSHTDAQLNFLRGEKIGQPVGMLIEGSYWENETKDASNLALIKDLYADYYSEMDYRFMPMPHQYEGRVQAIGTVGENGVTQADGIKQVGIDSSYQYGIINAHAIQESTNPTVAERVSKIFLQFLCTDEMLRGGTVVNGMFRNYEYELSQPEYDSLSGFAKSVYDVKQNGQVVIPFSNSSVFVKNMSSFNLSTLTGSLFTSENYSYPINAFRAGQTLDAFFEGIAAYRGQSWWNKLNK